MAISILIISYKKNKVSFQKISGEALILCYLDSAKKEKHLKIFQISDHSEIIQTVVSFEVLDASELSLYRYEGSALLIGNIEGEDKAQNLNSIIAFI